MKKKTDVQQGTLALMVLKTLDFLGPLHGYGLARRIEQISGDLLTLNTGTLYPLLLRLEQEGAIASERGPSENNRSARFYRLTERRTQAAAIGNPRVGADGGRHGPVRLRDAAGSRMRTLRRFLRRLTASVTRRRDEDRLREELEDHIAMEAEANVRNGMPAADARRHAVRRVGAGEALREDYRDEQSLPAVEHLLQDARIAVRRMTQAPGFTVAAVAILALGLGLTSAVASLAYALFLRPLPVDDASQVVFVGPPENARRGFPGPFPTTCTIAITRACSPTWPRTTRRRP